MRMRSAILVSVASLVTVVNAACSGSSGSPTQPSGNGSNPSPNPNPNPAVTLVNVAITNIMTISPVAGAVVTSDAVIDSKTGKPKEFKTDSSGIAVVEVPTNKSTLDIVIAAAGYHGPYETTLTSSVKSFKIMPLLGENNDERITEMVFGGGTGISNPGIVSTAVPAGNISLVYVPGMVPESDLAVLRETMETWIAKASEGRYTAKVETQASNPVVFTLAVNPAQLANGVVSIQQYNSLGQITVGKLTIRGDGKLTRRTSNHEAAHMLGLFHHKGRGLLGELGEEVEGELSQAEQDNLRYIHTMPSGTRHIRNDRPSTVVVGLTSSQSQGPMPFRPSVVFVCEHK